MTEIPQPPRRPGAWPVPRTFLATPGDDHQYAGLWDQTAAAHARWEITLGGIRSHLECPHCHPTPGMDHQELRSVRTHLDEQPSPQAIRAAARQWIAAITNIQDELIEQRRNDR